MITAENLSLSYGQGQARCLAVNAVSMKVERGEFVMILGPSGSGKSSLLYLLSGLRSPSSGNVFYLGRDLSCMRASEVARMRYECFGFIFQQHFLVPYLTAVENVCMGRKDALGYRARVLLHQLHLAGKENALPTELSYGQRQRVAVARALVHEPQVIFADEPTASVDSELATEICDWLRHYCGAGHICIMATHDSRLIKHASTVYSIRDGHLGSATRFDDFPMTGPNSQ
jgi:putative ABC transport system ATP-binding protein